MSSPEALEPYRPAPNRGLWIVVAVVAAAWVGYLALRGSTGAGPNLDPRAGALGKASYDWKLTDLDGRPVSFSRFKGKPLFLNLWATWCGPCVMEMPSIDQLAASPELRKNGVVVLAIATGGEDAETVRRFVQDHGYRSVTILRADEAPPDVFATDAIPATFLVAPDGRIAARTIGSSEWNTPSTIALLVKLAAETPLAVAP